MKEKSPISEMISSHHMSLQRHLSRREMRSITYIKGIDFSRVYFKRGNLAILIDFLCFKADPKRKQLEAHDFFISVWVLEFFSN